MKNLEFFSNYQPQTILQYPQLSRLITKLPHLLPPNVIEHLKDGKVFPESDALGKYSEEFLFLILLYLLHYPTQRLSSVRSQENIAQFLRTFPPNISYQMLNVLIEYNQPFQHVTVDSDKVQDLYWLYTFVQETSKDCIVFFQHGRFNGVPTPGQILGLIELRKRFPQSIIIVGCDDNELLSEQQSIPFLTFDTRAALLLQTGLIDYIVLIDHHLVSLEATDDQPNFYGNSFYDEITQSSPWKLPYSFIVINADPKSAINSGDAFNHKEIKWTPHYSSLHQTNLAQNTVSSKDLQQAWENIRSELQHIKQQ